MSRPDLTSNDRLRIGIILPLDRRSRLCLDLPDLDYRVGQHSARRCHVDCRVDGSAVRVEFQGHHSSTPANCSSECVIEPIQHDVVDRNGVTLRDCPAGRGFHWSKTISPVLPERVVISVVDGNLMLINELHIETYLHGVITAEMSGTCPVEFMMAQAIVARSWITAAAERKHREFGIDFCNDDCCQRFQGIGCVSQSARRAVEQTADQVLIHNSGSVVDANYSKCCGGIVESPENVWGCNKPGQHSVHDSPRGDRIQSYNAITNDNIRHYVAGEWLNSCQAYCSPNVVASRDLPEYLGAVDDGGGHFRWKIHFSGDELAEIIQRKHIERAGLSVDHKLLQLNDLRVLKRGSSGRATSMAIDYLDGCNNPAMIVINDQYAIRNALSDTFLYSSAFDVNIERSAAGVVTGVEFLGAGWGHGAGMCQWGAKALADQGWDFRQILEHYYPGTELQALY